MWLSPLGSTESQTRPQCEPAHDCTWVARRQENHAELLRALNKIANSTVSRVWIGVNPGEDYWVKCASQLWYAHVAHRHPTT